MKSNREFKAMEISKMGKGKGHGKFGAQAIVTCGRNDKKYSKRAKHLSEQKGFCLPS